jgi:glucosamine--fructose-6-phosphate aminotransferase (isomerizing)
VLLRQVEHLAADLRRLSDPISEQVAGVLAGPDWAAYEDYYLIGSGDSHYAGVASEMAFWRLARVSCRAVSAQRFADYDVDRLSASPGRPVVIGASASGKTPEVVAALGRARERGARTVAITGAGEGPVAQSADHAIAVQPPGLEASPGIRTYQATLAGLLLFAARLSALRCNGNADPVSLARLADHVELTAGTVRDSCAVVGREVAVLPGLAFAGMGPSLGAAMFGAAKIVEGAGVMAVATDLGEWWHVQRRAMSRGMPLFVIAPPGRSLRQAALVAAAAHELGLLIIAVVDDGDQEISSHANSVIRVQGAVPEEFSPLLYHVFAGYLAAFVGEALGRELTGPGASALPATLDAFGAAGAAHWTQDG